jgi:hypothetical protein
MFKQIRFFLLVLLSCTLFSCKKGKLQAPESAFIIVKDITVKTKTNNPNQGSGSHAITDIWYYVNGEFKGVFPVGNVMPIVATGNVEIVLMAGIKNNGISETRIPYPPYNSVKINLNIEPGKTYTLNPQFEYNTTAFFYYAEDCEGTGTYFNTDGNYNCSIIPDPENVFGKSYYMTMYDSASTARLLQTNQYFLPGSGATVYVEMNYKCNQEITLGLKDDLGNFLQILNITPTDEWKKIYIQLTNTVTASSRSNFRVYVQATKAVSNPSIYIDNIKLIYQ